MYIEISSPRNCSNNIIQGVPEVAHHANFLKLHMNKNFINNNHNRCSNCSPSALLHASMLFIIFTHIWSIKNKLLNLHGARLLGHPVYTNFCTTLIGQIPELAKVKNEFESSNFWYGR